MSTKLQTAVDTAEKLSPLEQLELLRILSESLHRNFHQTLLTEDFWQPKTLDQLLRAQQTSPVADIDELAVDFWPEEESVDDLVEYIYQQRDEDRLKDR